MILQPERECFDIDADPMDDYVFINILVFFRLNNGDRERENHFNFFSIQHLFHIKSNEFIKPVNNCFNVECWQDRIIARLQQPYSLDCIPVEAEYQVGPTSFISLSQPTF